MADDRADDLWGGVVADQGYWAAIYVEHRANLLRAAVAILGKDRSRLGVDAEAIVQTVMSKLIRKGQPIRADNVAAYLTAAVKNEALRLLSQWDRRPRDELARDNDPDPADWPAVSPQDVAREVTDQVIREKTDAALPLLDERLRYVFHERVLKGRTLTDIAGDLDVSDVWAGKLLVRAVRQIRDEIKVHPNDDR